ncbi:MULTISPECIES: hypothetical protein [Thermoactinomyces]|jgi:hypothetical protein|uniref:Uncharacterized protein n=1 Tax=Thermoactinomyces daqus TaxID=1329516 RepID=A0A7W1X7Q5_9BACL|nr:MULTISPECIES: hypothetical protein [Thermoactinomyces]MBA4541626.1 hypothetical protein [Thermoactinomyces daqus]MBH8597622.1 hypothetical protein [Thermoactinomyces sp. CICC 10523]MBH8603963.1 hypothetical protein [Thermoactinomyces sp. CICC 10522]MBH8606503.1 hypothetical protein [Thermoactinomyces sp. CICC 10521]
MVRYRYIPNDQLTQAIGKPIMLRLKNGKKLYGTIDEVRKNGIMFLPARVGSRGSSGQAEVRLFVPFFIPFGFFVPFLIIF